MTLKYFFLGWLFAWRSDWVIKRFIQRTYHKIHDYSSIQGTYLHLCEFVMIWRIKLYEDKNDQNQDIIENNTELHKPEISQDHINVKKVEEAGETVVMETENHKEDYSSVEDFVLKESIEIWYIWHFVIEKHSETFNYRTHAIITRCLYIFYPVFKTVSLFSRRFFQKISSLCMVSIQDRFVIRNLLWWRLYSRSTRNVDEHTYSEVSIISP